MGRISKTEANARQQEILDVTVDLYQTIPFHDLNLKMIGERLSFTRTAIYTYFNNIEEIFLAILEREYCQWNQDLKALLAGPKMTREHFADAIAKSLGKRLLMLKILAVDMSSLDAKSRLTSLIELKAAYGRAIELLHQLLAQNFPKMTDDEVDQVVFAFMPFLYGVYPYTIVTEKQKTAMEEAQVAYVYWTPEAMISNCLLTLLK